MSAPSHPTPLPMTRGEMTKRGWQELDVLLVTGDAYIDHPAFGAALIGRVLEADGWRVGVIAQPDWTDPTALLAMGRPRLFCGVTSGNLDSMLAHYTAARRRRHQDSYTEGGRTGGRPNRSCVVYAQLARRAFPGLPVVLGGIEASLRRVAHYDYWQDALRPSILLSSKADILVYGMGEYAVRRIARRLADSGADLGGIRGTARLLGASHSSTLDTRDCVMLPSWDDCRSRGPALLDLTRKVEAEQNPACGRRIVQLFDKRALVVEPPAPTLDPAELDRVHELPFARKPHPVYRDPIPAFDMISNSIAVVRGCPGGCSFCTLGLHQGKGLVSRTPDSVLREVATLAAGEGFRGTVSDLGGPTANLYACRNAHTEACARCRRPSCLFPDLCPSFEILEEPALELLRRAREAPGVKHVFISSGIRMDVMLRTPRLLREVVRHHVSGHLKIAPEHVHPAVLRRMRKAGADVFSDFCKAFERESRAAGKEQYVVPYFISSFPGCTDAQMSAVQTFLERENWRPQQVQDFIPLPMTVAAAMYYTGLDYETGEAIFVPRGLSARKRQMDCLRPRQSGRGSDARPRSQVGTRHRRR